jgi:hypothetical protein
MTEPVMHEAHVRIGREPGRGGERMALVISVLVLIAILKPWGTPPAAEPIAPREPSNPGQSSVTPTEPVRVADHACNNLNWLIQVDMLWPRRLVRSWILTDAVVASGPTDPRIHFVTVASPEVRALGYCPARSDEVPPGTRPTFYRLGPPVELVATDSVTPPKSAEGPDNVLYRPAAASSSPSPSGASPAPITWAGGRYVMRIDGPSGFQRWLGLEIWTIDDDGARR